MRPKNVWVTTNWKCWKLLQLDHQSPEECIVASFQLWKSQVNKVSADVTENCVCGHEAVVTICPSSTGMLCLWPFYSPFGILILSTQPLDLTSVQGKAVQLHWSLMNYLASQFLFVTGVLPARLKMCKTDSPLRCTPFWFCLTTNSRQNSLVKAWQITSNFKGTIGNFLAKMKIAKDAHAYFAVVSCPFSKHGTLQLFIAGLKPKALAFQALNLLLHSNMQFRCYYTFGLLWLHFVKS